MPELIEHVRSLAEEIGPRAATSDAERSAAEWLERTFAARGLETEMQDFTTPRSYSWAFVLYNLLTLASTFAAGFRPAGFKPILAWPAFAVSAIVAFFMWGDLETRWGLTRLMRKGPSQNVIARHVPRARRGEKLHRIVIVAHYDSARASLAFAPNMVGKFAMTFALMKWATFLSPVFILALAMPFTAKLSPWLWYATMAVSAYLVVPLVINIHRELFMPFVPGANDNASGVAAMLGVMERIVPAPDATTLATGKLTPVRRGRDAAFEAGVVPEETELRYSSDETVDPASLPNDFKWAEPVTETRERGQGILDFDTIEFATISTDRVASDRREPRAGVSAGTWADDDASDEGSASDAADAQRGDVVTVGDDAHDAPARAGLLGRLGARRKDKHGEEVTGWLGVDDGFDARKAGKEIGSWDNFGGEDDEDGFGWKGGWAGEDPIGDPEFAASEAARIRRRVTETVDRELTEKEVWFVATGAEEVGTCGMEAFLRDYGDDLKDAMFINIDGCGAGQLFWASAEGMGRRYRANPRLVGLARRVSRETDTLIKPRVYKGLSTDATPALVRGFKAMSIMAFDPASGMPVNWHWKTDTVDNIDAAMLETTADFIAAMVRQA